MLQQKGINQKNAIILIAELVPADLKPNLSNVERFACS